MNPELKYSPGAAKSLLFWGGILCWITSGLFVGLDLLDFGTLHEQNALTAGMVGFCIGAFVIFYSLLEDFEVFVGPQSILKSSRNYFFRKETSISYLDVKSVSVGTFSATITIKAKNGKQIKMSTMHGRVAGELPDLNPGNFGPGKLRELMNLKVEIERRAGLEQRPAGPASGEN